MTLILNCVTPRFVFQASDRRLTWSRGPKRGAVADDESNKAVLVDCRVAFGYTGLAQIGSESTDRWLAKTIGDGATRDMSVVLSRVRDRATEAFDRMKSVTPQEKRHAFLGVGWVLDASMDDLVPATMIATNALREGQWLDRAEQRFWSGYKLHNSLPLGFELQSAGLIISEAHQGAVVRFLKRLGRRSPGQAAWLRALTIVRRYLSDHYPIGRSLMVLSIPRSGVEHYTRSGHCLALLGPPHEDHPTFAYIPPSPHPIQWYGPHFVHQGMVTLDFTAGPASSTEGGGGAD